MARSSALSVALALFAVLALFQRWAPSFASPSPNRREVLQAAGVAVATAGVQAAYADAQGEPVTCLARYGPQVLGLKGAVEKGDMQTILKKEPKFKALNSYWRNQPGFFEKKAELTEKLLEAADSGNKAEVQKLYTEYVSDPVFEAFKVPVKRAKDTVTIYSYGAGKSTYEKCLNKAGRDSVSWCCCEGPSRARETIGADEEGGTALGCVGWRLCDYEQRQNREQLSKRALEISAKARVQAADAAAGRATTKTSRQRDSVAGLLRSYKALQMTFIYNPWMRWDERGALQGIQSVQARDVSLRHGNYVLRLKS
ncbi:hypothetical protein AK812_SmicGene4648 [Symbiodinium microadriaticum]|uniref:Photosystem II Psb31 protein domain-containing protein n=1 Tax=Symbiodinium microadriaticum TaxID=2951 RepID=A0A1Q9EVX8_SYMMI|nr:hypothetical protein AK812_SmicGene4648 [Symbiodinium microadriaticum]CAE7775855.1 unnamed protein product [Symbiodinium microadriaticum]CAE7894505.1 unnamed protein product [Symbiodinium sp. KB8]